jgi:hypothetical protein
MDNQTLSEDHWLDEIGRPAGGISTSRGLEIHWQNGPLGRGEDRKDPNGAFVETVLRAARGRIEFYERSGFSCAENQEALGHINYALAALAHRTSRRETDGTEGTHEGH